MSKYTDNSRNQKDMGWQNRYLSSYNNRTIELLMYVIGWGLVFLLPLLTESYSCLRHSQTFDFTRVERLWLNIAPFLILFLIHNYLLLPILLRHNSKFLYWGLVVVLIGFTVVAIQWFHALGDVLFHTPPHHHNPPRRPPHFVIAFFYISNSLFAGFVVSINLALRLYFNSVNNKLRIEALESERIASQLEYLKFQLNPHFFMNTLNNIHALVDIDPEKSKEMIVILSKLMRYLLYEVDNKEVALESEICFIKNYIELMKLRLTDIVKVEVFLPEDCENIHVPPLLFISFVENAFKHGVSYKHPSYVKISLEISSDHLEFRCKNSLCHSGSQKDKGGIGLSNIRQRLNLLYHGNEQLTISTDQDTYMVEMTIPLYHNSSQKHLNPLVSQV